ncbi:Asp23/Gls24 family envelope stress response protein [Cellulomonas sp. RIT-PI-Y]|uniref:Asp23/Gls24 family envelope stress response protein n=1 Tax=Cellulomonas sp. RIT-PI-Y TaxID=3035297 RepID=UPI0021D9B787|nr:Asp23/Gls24 family envelope stress response protein [Cellulomonas sp. RIT-PI-Y]
MSEQTSTTPSTTPSGRPGRGDVTTTSNTGSLQTDHGTTSIADAVVSKIAGIAASDVAGVHALGGGAARAFGAIRERIPGGTTNHSQGISVEVGETQAAIDVELVAEYGVAIADLAQGVRRNIVTSVERMTGLEVIEVNIAVSDVHLPEDDADPTPDAEPRVQ